MFSVLICVPLKRYDGRWAEVEIVSASFSMSNYFSEKGVLDYVVQKSGIVGHPQALSESSADLILNMFVLNKKVSKFLCLAADKALCLPCIYSHA